jgi:hypothetical protein
MDAVGADDHVADELRVDRNGHVERILDRAHRGDRVHGRADAADALGVDPRVARVTPLEDLLDATPHLARGPGVGDLATVHLAVDAEVALDAGDRINRDSCHG